MEGRIQELERDLRMERVLNEDYKEAAKVAKEVALDASTRAKQVAVAATKACAFVENT